MTLRNLVEEWNAKNGEKYSKEFLDRFIAYWEKGNKWEKQKSWTLGLRLAVFNRMSRKFEKENKIKKFKNLLGNVNPLR